MDTLNRLALVCGGAISLFGIIGCFAYLTQHDGALAIAGSVVFAAGLIASALSRQRQPPGQ